MHVCSVSIYRRIGEVQRSMLRPSLIVSTSTPSTVSPSVAAQASQAMFSFTTCMILEVAGSVVTRRTLSSPPSTRHRSSSSTLYATRHTCRTDRASYKLPPPHPAVNLQDHLEAPLIHTSRPGWHDGIKSTSTRRPQGRRNPRPRPERPARWMQAAFHARLLQACMHVSSRPL